MMPGVPERSHSYVRRGTTSLLAALALASGFVIGKCSKRLRAIELLDFLKQIDARVPADLDIHIIMDNHATHKTARFQALLARRPQYHVLHADLRPMDQPGRALVCLTDTNAAAPRPALRDQPARAGHSLL
jgi:hypothetical protein